MKRFYSIACVTSDGTYGRFIGKYKTLEEALHSLGKKGVLIRIKTTQHKKEVIEAFNRMSL